MSPYQVSPSVVEKVLKQLDILANTKEDSVEFQTGSPAALKYALHQAFHAAEKLRFQKYANLGKEWKVRIRGVKVICEKRGILSPANLNSASEEIRRKRYSISKFTELIGILIAEGMRYEFQHFPGYVLVGDEERQLNNLCTIQKKKWYYDDDPINGLTVETNPDA